MGVLERIIRPARSPVPPAADGTVVAPFQFVLSGSENLRVCAFSLTSAYTLVISGRMLRPDGAIEPFAYNLRGVVGVEAEDDFALGPGAILNLVIFVGTIASGSAEFGNIAAQAQVVQGRGLSATVVGVLVQSYVSTHGPIAWPGTPIRTLLEAPGLPSLTTFPAPAAGAGAQWNVSAFAHVKPKSLFFVMSTSAAVGTRTVGVQILIGGQQVFQNIAPINQTASTTAAYNLLFGIGTNSAPSPFVALMAMPGDLTLTSGVQIRTFQNAFIDAGDQFGLAQLLGDVWQNLY